MSEPITLYRQDEMTTVYAPSEAVRLVAEGWQPTPVVTEVAAPLPMPAMTTLGEDVDDTVTGHGGEYTLSPGRELEAIPSVVRKAGRPKKVE